MTRSDHLGLPELLEPKHCDKLEELAVEVGLSSISPQELKKLTSRIEAALIKSFPRYIAARDIDDSSPEAAAFYGTDNEKEMIKIRWALAAEKQDFMGYPASHDEIYYSTLAKSPAELLKDFDEKKPYGFGKDDPLMEKNQKRMFAGEEFRKAWLGLGVMLFFKGVARSTFEKVSNRVRQRAYKEQLKHDPRKLDLDAARSVLASREFDDVRHYVPGGSTGFPITDAVLWLLDTLKARKAGQEAVEPSRLEALQTIDNTPLSVGSKSVASIIKKMKERK